MSTLRYASRAKFIRNRPRVNEDPKVGAGRVGGWRGGAGEWGQPPCRMPRVLVLPHFWWGAPAHPCVLPSADSLSLHLVPCVPQDAMLREFQEEIARLRAQLAERQQARAASAGGTPAGGSPDKAGALGPGGGGAPGEERGGGSGQAQSGAGAEAGAAAIRQSVRADLERQLRRAATTEALAKARQAIEAQARWVRGGRRGVTEAPLATSCLWLCQALPCANEYSLFKGSPCTHSPTLYTRFVRTMQAAAGGRAGGVQRQPGGAAAGGGPAGGAAGGAAGGLCGEAKALAM